MPRQHDRSLLIAVGARIREIRSVRGLTQEVLAERARIEPRTLSGMENGRQGASLAVLAALAHALDVPLPALVDVHGSALAPDVSSREEWIALWDHLTDRQRGVALRLAKEIAAL